MAGTASICTPWRSAASFEHGDESAAGDVGGALADGEDPGDRAVGEAAGGWRRGKRGLGQHDLELAVGPLDEAAAQRLAEADRRLGDLLEQEVRELAPVDVAGRDLGRDDVVLGHGQRRAVVGDPLDALERAGAIAVEQEDLAPAGVGVVGVGRGLAVHADVARRLLDQAVGLGRHDVGVAGEADVERLARAAEGEEQRVGPVGDGGGDGHRALERRPPWPGTPRGGRRRR